MSDDERNHCYMEKTVILLYQDGSICSLLRIAGRCDGITDALSAAEREWNSTEEGRGTDYDSFVLEYLAGHGYEARMEEGFECYRTCL